MVDIKTNKVITMEMFKFRAVLLVFALYITSSTGQDEIAMASTHVCQEYPGNKVKMTFQTYERNDILTDLEAIDDQNQTVATCDISGTGTLQSPYTVDITIDLNFDYLEDNECGMERTGSIMNWRFRALGQAFQRKGFIVNVPCDLNDLPNGRVDTLVEVEVDEFVVRAADPLDVTGDNAVATGADLIYEVNVAPSSSYTPIGLQDAAGIYVYSCYYATNPGMAQRQLFIDANGCPTNSAYAPTNPFRAVSNGDVLTITAQNATAVVIQNERNIYFTCLVGKCTLVGDTFCNDRCSAFLTGLETSPFRIDTGIEIRTSFTVQDRDAQVLEARDLNGNVVSVLNVGSPFRLCSLHTPGGIGGTPALEAAAGFFIYNCRYSLNGNMNNAQQFIGNDGCVIPGTELSPASPPAYDAASSAPNLYALKTGLIIPDVASNRRYRIQCDTGICLNSNHNYCRLGRCGADDNLPGEAINLGFIGQELTLSVLDVLRVPAIDIVVVDEDGDAVNETNNPTVGQQIDFNIVVTPGGQGDGGDAFFLARGIYVYSCFVFPMDDPIDRTYVLDSNGCAVPDSPYQLTKRCTDANPESYNPPFEIDCGSMIIPEAGNFRYNCSIGICETADNLACQDRCAAGNIENLIGVSEPAGLSTTSAAFQSNFPEVISNERTAIRSEEIRNIIIAVCVVGAIVLLVIVSVGTCLIVKSQKARAKQSEDSRSYNY